MGIKYDQEYISCGKCRFFDLGEKEAKENGLGYCHRYPPKDYVSTMDNVYGTLTRAGFWCGEYRASGIGC